MLADKEVPVLTAGTALFLFFLSSIGFAPPVQGFSSGDWKGEVEDLYARYISGDSIEPETLRSVVMNGIPLRMAMGPWGVSLPDFFVGLMKNPQLATDDVVKKAMTAAISRVIQALDLGLSFKGNPYWGNLFLCPVGEEILTTLPQDEMFVCTGTQTFRIYIRNLLPMQPTGQGAKPFEMKDVLPSTHDYIVPPLTPEEQKAQVQRSLLTYMSSFPGAEKYGIRPQ